MKYLYESSPYVSNKRSTKGIMIDVCIALVPALIAAIVFFGINSLILVVLAILGSVATEVVYKLALKKDFKSILKEFDFTTLVTGLLLGLNMPPMALTYWYVPFISGVFAIAIVKMLFGGTGCNIVNPAIAGRVFALMSFSVAMTQSYVLPKLGVNGVAAGATPLTQILNDGAGSGAIFNMGLSNMDLFLGLGVAGTIGETCKLALLIGGIYLVVRKVINPLYPVIYILVTGLFQVALNGFNVYFFLPSILSGGLFLGAIFMATDYVTTPNTFIGNVIYFAILGLVTAALRTACSMEVVSFAILLCNLIVPLIDKYIVPKPFGYVKKEGK